MKRLTIFLLIISCSLLSFVHTSAVAQTNDLDRMKSAITEQMLSHTETDAIVKDLAERYFPNGVKTDQCLMELVANSLPSDKRIERLISTINSDGSWEGIYYTSPARSAWEAQAHIENIVTLARAYNAESSKYYNDPTTLAATTAAIEYWCDGGFECKNWWYNCIGVPKALAPALLLLEGDISRELMARAIKILDPADSRTMTGQNKVWLNGVTLIKGLLKRDREMIERTSSAIKEELKLSHDEGIQYDWSFHQHGAMQQFGNYGLAFASSISYWMRILNNTEYDFTREQKEILCNYFTKGLNVTIWRGYMDISSCGRQIFHNSQSGKAASLLISNLNMMTLSDIAPDTRAQFEEYITRNFIEPRENNLVGNIAYPISKYTIHRTAESMFSVKMFTSKVLGGEITNNENIKGYHLADGATMIYRTGHEYENIPPIWEAKYMPGTTVAYNDEPCKVLKHATYYVNGSDFAGCIGDGEWGVTAFEYRRDGVSANKSWFFFADQVVCLGNGISTESGEPTITTLNQCNWQGETYRITGKRLQEVKLGESGEGVNIFSDGVGYRSLDDTPIHFAVREQVGDWHDVAGFYPEKEERGDIFMAQLHHTASYAYMVQTEAERDKFLKGRNKLNFRILQNNESATAVASADGECVMVVFWRGGSILTKEMGEISSTAPAMAIIKREGKQVEVEKYLPIDNGAVICVGSQKF